MNDCDEEPICIQNCLEQGTQAAQPLLNCLLSSSCTDLGCFESQCDSEFNAWTPDILDGNTDDRQDWYSCGDILSCLGDCDNTPTCRAQYIFSGEGLVQLKFWNVDLCAQNWGCQD